MLYQGINPNHHLELTPIRETFLSNQILSEICKVKKKVCFFLSNNLSQCLSVAHCVILLPRLTERYRNFIDGKRGPLGPQQETKAFQTHIFSFFQHSNILVENSYQILQGPITQTLSTLKMYSQSHILHKISIYVYVYVYKHRLVFVFFADIFQ